MDFVRSMDAREQLARTSLRKQKLFTAFAVEIIKLASFYVQRKASKKEDFGNVRNFSCGLSKHVNLCYHLEWDALLRNSLIHHVLISFLPKDHVLGSLGTVTSLNLSFKL